MDYVFNMRFVPYRTKTLLLFFMSKFQKKNGGTEQNLQRQLL